MNDAELRVLFASFAILKMDWNVGYDEENAKDCFTIADAMIKASKSAPLDDMGIAAIKKRRPRKAK